MSVLSFAIVAFLANCTVSDVSPGRPGSSQLTTATPDSPPPGFAMLMLAPVDPLPIPAASNIEHPAGVFWYRLVTVAGTTGTQLEWYVRAQHLQPGRAFRVELSVDDNGTYAIGSARADPTGSFTTHGVLSRFADQFCVGQRSDPLPIDGVHRVSVSVKSDGSHVSASLGPSVTDPTRSLPCSGNGDGVFDYWLTAQAPFQLGGASAKTPR